MTVSRKAGRTSRPRFPALRRVPQAVGSKTVPARTPKTPRRLRQVEAKRAAILNAALALFSRNGLHGTTVEQIAETADISKANLFYYFSGKEAVYVAVLRDLLDEWLAPFREMSADDDPMASLGDYIRKKIVFSRIRPEASRLFCIEMIGGAPLLGDELRSSVRELVRSKASVISAWIEAGLLAPVDPYHLIFTIWATTQHYADFAVQIEAMTGRSLAEEAFLEETIASVSRIILDGVRPRPA